VYFWQNTSIISAYDVLVTAVCQKLTLFWGLVYDDDGNDKDNEDNNDKDDKDNDDYDDDDNNNNNRGGSADYLLVSFITRPDCELFKHEFIGSRHLKYIQWPHLQIPQEKHFHIKT
jgi:hypothetical protein